MLSYYFNQSIYSNILYDGYEICNWLSSYLILCFIHVVYALLVTIQPDNGLHI